ncbi:hypothetical protein [Saccharothrix xinjiangensis]|uniref:Uncharacterized protein n=1 Tax=Saccharothrix xinjiangensis TaxID=204798 RepID=A0ABV9XW19_9PSEU
MTGRDDVVDEPDAIRELFEGSDVDVDAMLADEDPVQVAIDYVQGVLLGRIADPVQRWKAVAALADALPAALDRVRALCVGQLVADDQSVADAARQLGISRQRANELLKGENHPTPRELKRKPAEDEPGYRFGIYLGAASYLAEAMDKARPTTGARRQLTNMTMHAHLQPAGTHARVTQAFQLWLKRFPGRFRELRAELEQASADLGDLPHTLSLEQQSHMFVAQSKTRLRLAAEHKRKAGQAAESP